MFFKVENKLEIAKKFFAVNDKNKTGFLPLYQVPEIIQQAFFALGFESGNPSIENIIQIMQSFNFSDQNKVNTREFEELFALCLTEVVKTYY